MTAKTILLQNIINITSTVTANLIRDFYEIEYLQSSSKGPWRFAANALKFTELRLSEKINRAYPEATIISNGKELFKGNSDIVFTLCPIDGYANFTRALRYFSCVVAIDKIKDNEKETIASLIYAPILGEIFYAEKNNGAWFSKTNENIQKSFRLRCTMNKELPYASFASYNLDNNLQQQVAGFTNLANNNLNLKASSIMAAYVAAARFDSFFVKFDNEAIKKAATLMVKEAGGYNLDYNYQHSKNDDNKLILTASEIAKNYK